MFLQDIAHYPVDPPPAGPLSMAPPVPPGCPLRKAPVISEASAGEVWVGGPDGAARWENGGWRCFWGKRWLPGNRVQEFRHDGWDTYLRTDAGWARIERRSMTLEWKADHYQALTEERHTRRGYVAKCLVTPQHGFRAVDNDGLWTSLYVAAESFRYYVTHDPEAKRLADESANAILDLERLTGVSGFPARSVFWPGEDVLKTKGEWRHSPVEEGVRWKGDTSSDELSGHFFAYHVYGMLAADDSQRARVAAAAERILDHLIENDLRLIDADGLPTRWADFSPESLNGDPRWRAERGLNSLCILAYLRVGARLTGHERYLRLYDELVWQYGYADNAISQKVLAPFDVNHSDDQLAFLAFYSALHLLRHGEGAEEARCAGVTSASQPAGGDEPRPGASRSTAIEAEDNNHGGAQLLTALKNSLAVERPERCPLYNLIAASIVPDAAAVTDARHTLEEWPWDLREWTCRNRHRTDITYDAMPDRFRRPQLTHVLSPAERPVYRWNSNPYLADGGKDGEMEEDGAAWLLAYWLGRYHGLLD